MTSTQRKPVPIYTSAGDAEAYLVYPHLFNRRGEWIGFVTPEKEVYSVYGEYVGWLTSDPRILRKRSQDYSKPRLTPPSHPRNYVLPALAPLAPMMSELSFETVDVLQDDRDKLPTVDTGEFRPDMD
jgi:hypothetical protein